MTTQEDFAQTQLNIFYGPNYQTRDITLDDYEYSGYTLGEKILIAERVVHVGCANNPFKGMIANLVGVDPVNSAADQVMTMEQFAYSFKSQKFDVAFCLGSINYGTDADIQRQIATVIDVLKKRDSRIYWRCFAGGTDQAGNPYYPWTFDKHVEFAELFNFSVVEMYPDANNSIYAEWLTNNRSPV